MGGHNRCYVIRYQRFGTVEAPPTRWGSGEEGTEGEMGVNGRVSRGFDGIGEHLYIGSRTVFSGPFAGTAARIPVNFNCLSRYGGSIEVLRSRFSDLFAP